MKHPQIMTMENTFYILFTIVAIAWNILVLQAAGLDVEPLWDVSRNDTDACLVITSGNETMYRGSSSHLCNLNVTATKGNILLLEIQGTDQSNKPSYLYVKRVGESLECPNKYVTFTENMETCSAVFIHRDIEIVLQGDISVSVSSIPVMEAIPLCPELEWDTVGSEVSQTSVCKNVKGFDDIVKCESYDNSECKIKFKTDCDTILGPNEVVYQCNDGLQTHTDMIVYSLQITSLELSWNNLI